MTLVNDLDQTGRHLTDSYIRYNTKVLRPRRSFCRNYSFSHDPMVSTSTAKLYILGVTNEGKTFRPSDWAERLAGVMSQFRPGGPQPGSHLGYSPWCVPTTHDGHKCVIVDRALEAAEFMAWEFVLGFALDNHLTVKEVAAVEV